MLNKFIISIVITYACALVIDYTLQCSCEEIMSSDLCGFLFQCVWENEQCIHPLLADIKDYENCRKYGYEWNNEKGCEEFTNCSNYNTDKTCPFDFCRFQQEKCVPYISANQTCLNYKTNETCFIKSKNYCYWNDKNICLDRELLKTCEDFNIYDYTSECTTYSCNFVDGKCIYKDCTEYIKESTCPHGSNRINKTHTQICDWVNNRCIEVTNFTKSFPNTTACQFVALDQFQFYNSECKQCTKLVPNLKQKYALSYNDDYYSSKYSNSSSTIEQNTSQNSTQGTTTNPSSSTTDQNQNTSQNTTQGSTSNPQSSDSNQTISTTNSTTQTGSIILSAIIISSICLVS